MYRKRTRMLLAAGVFTAIAVGFFSAIGILAEDATPTPPLASRSSEAAPDNPSRPAIDLVDIGFTPKELSIPANTPTEVTLVNQGVAVHTFDIDELNVHSGDVQSGQSTSVVINAPVGTYTYFCSIPGHREAGMVGTLTVT